MTQNRIKDILIDLWKRHNFDMISLIFDILRKTLRPKVFGLVESIGLRGSIITLKIKGGSVEKGEVRLHQEEIIARVNEALGEERFTRVTVI
ncbi:MAG: hypothetical protein DDT42_00990 [candidate division WS2 bacterium]|uniref:Uncharacterized protein n=1 Tax=Psychracetigena formicireducens TaxID=2986056 RepID=A0A9E2BJ15_PSYF1|nr:hypothetical protein [Candidatus Psychracetigena formicireducens]